MHVLPLYAAVLGLIYVGLSFRTIGLRRKLRLSLGDGGDKALNRAIRVHSNFAEYVPLALILLFLLESQAYSRVLVHIFASMLVVGRVLHAYGVSQLKEKLIFRTTGMLLTLFSLIFTCLVLLYTVYEGTAV
ncbi:MAPEG family protein [Undibacterium cyanobacteriorum]|uniref:MAPEG family protein n=1 Tax=Undibacterium cyanobacteriorum TaxID=3073561 RepID=A0ABY9RLI6_9BURK|nr:MAPEG family protein [Undibacterium sp. 20NA77.5]WMW80861.1 MAPEG family protein [Undibacterium sp. 20NA77.5]